MRYLHSSQKSGNRASFKDVDYSLKRYFIEPLDSQRSAVASSSAGSADLVSISVIDQTLHGRISEVR